MLHRYWPLLGLRVRTPRLELRIPSDQDLFALAALAEDGVHDPSLMPFASPWTDVPGRERGRSVLQWFWGKRAEFSAQKWDLGLVTVVGGAVVGTQSAFAADYAVLREAETGSWLGKRYHGRGIGTEMRAAVLHLMFAGLGAVSITSAAFADNAPSLAVSRKLGYREDGISRTVRRGEPATMIRLRLPREVWERRRRDDIEIEGLAPCLPLLGLEGVGGEEVEHDPA